jgi:polar amino acid transport system substrate-binding protein
VTAIACASLLGGCQAASNSRANHAPVEPRQQAVARRLLACEAMNEEIGCSLMRRREVLAGAGSAALLGLAATRPARADTLDEVKKRGTLVVGMEAAYVPYEFFKDGKIIGYDPDIIEVFVGRLGVKAQLVDTAWNGIIPALYAKKFDVIISAMTITKERAEKVMFSMPYADASNVILLRAGEDRIKTADDLSGKTIGVQIGSAAAGIIKAFETKLKDKGKPGYADVKQYEHYPEAYQDLLNRRTDAVVNSKSTLMVVMHDAPGKFKIMPGISDITAYFGMAFRKEDTRLQVFCNEQLAELKKSGELAKLQEKWFAGTMVTPDTVPDVLP